MVSTVGNRGVGSNGLGGGLIYSAIKFICTEKKKVLILTKKRKIRVHEEKKR
jgi:hypothetical protein